jgi:6-phosphofructokinase
VVAVSEGIHDASGKPIAAQLAKSLEQDAHGNLQLSGSGALADLLCEEIKSKLGVKRVRGDTLGYLQRSFIGCVSDVDQREAREVGEKAVQFAMWGDRDAFISKSGTDVTDAFRLYLRPLLGSGMPDAFRLRTNPVAKVLRPG